VRSVSAQQEQLDLPPQARARFSVKKGRLPGERDGERKGGRRFPGRELFRLPRESSFQRNNSQGTPALCSFTPFFSPPPPPELALSTQIRRYNRGKRLPRIQRPFPTRIGKTGLFPGKQRKPPLRRIPFLPIEERFSPLFRSVPTSASYSSEHTSFLTPVQRVNPQGSLLMVYIIFPGLVLFEGDAYRGV